MNTISKHNSSAPDLIERAAEFLPLELKPPTVIKNTNKKVELKKSDLKLLLNVREIFNRHMKQAEEEKRSKTITEVDQKDFVLDISSLETLIVKVLSKSNDPVHITDIIANCETLGWDVSKVRNKHTSIYNVLKENYYMFTAVKEDFFTLRDGFLGTKPEKSTDKKETLSYDKDVATITDIVVSVASKYQKPVGINPARVHYITSRMGYRISFSSIYRVMQSDKFIRKENMYILNALY